MTLEIDRQLVIDAPAAVVWEVLTDLDSYGEWNTFVPRVTSTLQPGDPIVMSVRLFSRPLKQTERMASYSAGKGFAYGMRPVPLGALSSLRSHEVEAVDEEHTAYHSSFRLQGWLSGMVRLALGARLEAGFGAMNAGVKGRAEGLWAERRAEWANDID